MREPIVGSIREGIRQSIVGSSGASSSFTSLLTSSLVPQYGGVTPTFTRATTATVEDFEGLIRYVKSGEARFKGARRVENKIGNASSASLAVSATDTITVDADTVWVFSMGPGSGTVTFSGTATGSTGSLTANASNRTSATLTITGAGTIIMTASVAEVVDYQIEDVTGQANQNPSEYVSTGVGTGSELFTNFGDWTLDATFSGSGDTLSIDNDSGGLDFAISPDFVIGKDYVITYQVSNYVDGAVGFSVSDGTPIQYRSANGTYTETGQLSANTKMYVTAGNTTTADVTILSIKEADHGANRDGVKYFTYVNGNVPELRKFLETDGTGDYASTPATSATSPTTQIDLRFKARLANWTAANETIIGRYGSSSGDRGYMVAVRTDGTLMLHISEDGTTQFLPAVAHGFTNGQVGVGRVTHDCASGITSVYTSQDDGVTWDLQGTSSAASSLESIFTAVNVPEVMGYDGGAASPAGDLFWAEYRMEIDGPVTARFDAEDHVSGDTLTSSTTGEVWTFQNDAFVNFEETGVVTEAQGAAIADATLKGYLAEGARTNVLLRSNDFTNAVWLNGNSTETANYAVGSDGRKTATRLIDNAATGTGNVSIRQTSLTVTSGSNTFSIDAKADQLDWVRLDSQDFDAGGNGGSYFDLTNGVAGTVSGNHTARIRSLGNGWYRCSITFSTTTDLSGTVWIYVAEADGDIVVDLDGTSSILIGHGQLEAGSFPSTHIPTEGSAVTRNADSDTYDISVLGLEERGTVSAQFTLPETWALDSSTNFTVMIAYDTGYITDAVWVRVKGNTGTLEAAVYSGGVAQSTITGSTVLSAGNTYTVALAYSEDDVELYLNGSTEGTPDTSATMPTAISTLVLGPVGTTQFFYGNIRNVKIFNKRLTDTEVSRL